MGDFSADRASRLYDISQIALAAEQGDDDAVQRWKPDDIDNSDMKIIQHGSSTAVVVHDRASNEIVVSYDGSLEDVGDYVDDLNVIPTSHPNGGDVRSGFMNGITRESDDGYYLMDEVKEVVKEMADGSPEPVNLSFTGFSKGGSMAELTASVWLSERFPDTQSDNLRMNEVYTFGSPPTGNDQFVQNFETDMAREGMSKFRVDLGKDSVPNFTMGVMEQAGDHVLLVPLDGLDKTVPVLNPDDKIEDQLKNAMTERSDWHNIESYKTAIDQIDESLMNQPALEPVDPDLNPTLASADINTPSLIAP